MQTEENDAGRVEAECRLQRAGNADLWANGKMVNTVLRDGAYVTDPVLVDSGATYTPGISERRGTTTTYLHSGLKNAFAQSDTSQQVAATREYDAFGNVMSPTGTWAAPFGYAGKFGYQSKSIPGTSTPDDGLQLLGHRYYDSSTGRFLTRDPIFDGRNWYSYGGGEGNPLTGADPTGLFNEQIYRGFGELERAGRVPEGSQADYKKNKSTQDRVHRAKDVIPGDDRKNPDMNEEDLDDAIESALNPYILVPSGFGPPMAVLPNPHFRPSLAPCGCTSSSGTIGEGLVDLLLDLGRLIFRR